MSNKPKGLRRLRQLKARIVTLREDIFLPSQLKNLKKAQILAGLLPPLRGYGAKGRMLVVRPKEE